MGCSTCTIPQHTCNNQIPKGTKHVPIDHTRPTNRVIPEELIVAEAGVIRVPEAEAKIAPEAGEDPHTEEAGDNDVSVHMKLTQT